MSLLGPSWGFGGNLVVCEFEEVSEEGRWRGEEELAGS